MEEVAPPSAAALTGKLELLKLKVDQLSGVTASQGPAPLSPVAYQKPVLLESMLIAEGLEPEEDSAFVTSTGGQGTNFAVWRPTEGNWYIF